MEMTGTQLIPVPQAVVWEGLNDTETLKACVPGCESLEKVSDTEFKSLMTVAVGPVKAKFTGKLLLSDIEAPRTYRISFEGSGGAVGSAKGGAQVTLEAEGAGTRLNYTAKAQVGGKLAQIGSRLIDGVAKKMADDFFQRFNARLAAKAAVAVPQAAAAPAPAGSSRVVIWVFVALVILGGIAYWYLR